ncbi:LamG domain-containing protein [Baekduia soli]|uniref:LamG domain-containing protein n=1 Tax=Baekduia soli TaxID=496014 RepID=A0A5B8U4X8_9ACTN|nr:LamG domain-containing protein [Baekduia soli]QEC47945.1 LamG domain-containing protein [Baekduia soli]
MGTPRTRKPLRRRGAALIATSALTGAALLAGAGVASARTVSLWHMDEGPLATTMHDSVGGNDGTLSGVLSGVPGFLGNGYEFDGPTSVVTDTSAPSLNAGSQPFWFGARVKMSRPPNASEIDFDVMRKGLSSASGGFWKIEIFQSGQVHCSMKGSLTSRSLDGETVVTDGTWHSIYCFKDGDTERVIVDGRVDGNDGVHGSQAVTLGDFSNSAAFALGAKEGGGDQYVGLMDEASYGTGGPVVNSSAPAVVGQASTTGSGLTASTGTWDGLPDITYAYRWQRCDATGASCVPIGGATARTYAPVAADVGGRLRVAVTASNPLGDLTVDSAATAVVTGTPPPPPPPPPLPPPPPPVIPPVAAPPAAETPVQATGEPTPPSTTSAVCLRLRVATARRTATLFGHRRATLRISAATGRIAFSAPTHTIRMVTLTLDGRRLGTAHGGSLTARLVTAGLGTGDHVLKARLHPRHGPARTLTLHVIVAPC